MSGFVCGDFPPELSAEEEQFCDRLIKAGAVVWVGEPGLHTEYARPNGWQHLRWRSSEEVLATFEPVRCCLCLNTGLPVAVADADPRNGCDVEKVRDLLAGLKVRVYAEVATPSGGMHFYVNGHSDLPTVHSKTDNPKLPGFPGLDIQSFGANVFLPGTARRKYDGAGYTIIFDELDEL